MDKLRMQFPSRMADGVWKEALPLGNGRTGALLLGAVGEERLWVNHFDRWSHADSGDPIPDVSRTIPEMRRLQREGRFQEANNLLSEALNSAGYRTDIGSPTKPVGIRLLFESEIPFRDYERGLDLTRGEAYVTFTRDGFRQTRRAFVSRNSDEVWMEVTSETGMNVKIMELDQDGLNWSVLAIDGEREDPEGYVQLRSCTRFLLRCSYEALTEGCDYASELEKSLPLYRKAMGPADLHLCDENRFCESLLDSVYLGENPPELYEKLWAMGHYLLACGTAEDGNPFPLYGLWHGIGDPIWAQNVANENVQMIYWHALTGGLADLMKPLIHYYYGMMEPCREAARKMFGCRGIFVSVYTTPVSFRPAPNVPVIVNYIGTAGWLSRMFYDYYRYTGDTELLKSEILPFMLETAAFFEDYCETDDNGRIFLSPSVSPENTPENLMPVFTGQRVMSHPCPAVCNATMDIGILKDLLNSLLEIDSFLPLEEKRVARWKEILASIPEYMVNEDGAVREWMDERLQDNYSHRHLSHIYPLFPGDEIRKGDPLFGAFERAVDLRKLGYQSGWSLAHMACIYDRMGRGEKALESLHTMARSCLLHNFFTQHNDWRGMGLTLAFEEGTTVQLDALMGATNAVQEMLLRNDRDGVYLLPACPELFNSGGFSEWCVPGAKLDAVWNLEKSELSVTVTAERDVRLRIVYPDRMQNREFRLALKAGEKAFLQ